MERPLTFLPIPGVCDFVRGGCGADAVNRAMAASSKARPRRGRTDQDGR